MEEFVSLELEFGPCAVYLLLREGQVVYAGKSTNVFARIARHHQDWLRRKRGLKTMNEMTRSVVAVAFDEVRIRPCHKDHLDREEIALIQKHLPEKNIQLKRKAPSLDISKMDIFTRFVKEAQERRGPPIQRRKIPPNATPTRRVRGVTLPQLKCLA